MTAIGFAVWAMIMHATLMVHLRVRERAAPIVYWATVYGFASMVIGIARWLWQVMP